MVSQLLNICICVILFIVLAIGSVFIDCDSLTLQAGFEFDIPTLIQQHPLHAYYVYVGNVNCTMLLLTSHISIVFGSFIMIARFVGIKSPVNIDFFIPSFFFFLKKKFFYLSSTSLSHSLSERLLTLFLLSSPVWIFFILSNNVFFFFKLLLSNKLIH